VLAPPETPPDDEVIRRMVREGVASWGGGKPQGAKRPIKIRGKPISDTVLEDRR